VKKIARQIRSFFRLMRNIFINGWICRGRCRKLPKILIIEPTNLCNMQCVCCPHGNPTQAVRAKGKMTRETFMKILKNIDYPVNEICLYLHGEPFLHEDLDFFVGQTNQLKGVLTTIFSNGYRLNPDLLRKIVVCRKTRFSFSMDLVNKSYYEDLRKPAFYDKAIESLKQINDVFAEQNRRFELNIIADRAVAGNEQTIAKPLFESCSQLRKISFNPNFPWPEHFYTGDLSGRLSKNRPLCPQISGGVAVYWNGDVTMCSYDFAGKLIIGNLTVSKLSDIFNSEAARTIRKIHLFRRLKKLPLCEKCLLPRFMGMSKSITRSKTR
jgi:MoaA/NifB/PqqE/SkfB family radical SAM enzyme